MGISGGAVTLSIDREYENDIFILLLGRGRLLYVFNKVVEAI